MTYEQLLVAARNVSKLDPEFPRHLRDLLTDNGVLLQLLGQILETRDGFAEGVISRNLLTEEGRLQAIRAQGMVVGIDQIMTLIYNQAYQEDTNVQAKAA